MSSLQKDEETSFYEYQGNRVATAVFYVCTASDRIGGGARGPGPLKDLVPREILV